MMGRTPHGVTSAQIKDMFTLDIVSLQQRLAEFVDLHQINTEIEQASGGKNTKTNTTSALDENETLTTTDGVNSTKSLSDGDSITSQTISDGSPVVVN